MLTSSRGSAARSGTDQNNPYTEKSSGIGTDLKSNVIPIEFQN